MKKVLLGLGLAGFFVGGAIAKEPMISFQKEVPYKKVIEYTDKGRKIQVYSGAVVVEGTLHFDGAAMDNRHFSFEVSKKDKHKLPGAYNRFNIKHMITDNNEELENYAKFFGINYKKCHEAEGKAKLFIGEYEVDWGDESYIHVDASLLKAIDYKMKCVN